MLHSQLPWYLAGPALGLCVVACRLLLNGRLGVSGGYSELVGRIAHRSLRFDWGGLVLRGIVLRGPAFALIAGGPDFHGYGWLTATFTGSERVLVAPILIVAGVLVG